MDENIKPCPFCGGDAYVVRYSNDKTMLMSEVRCVRCGVRTGQRLCWDGYEPAVEVWNRRCDDGCDKA